VDEEIKIQRSVFGGNQRFDVRAARYLREIIIGLPAHWPARPPLFSPSGTRSSIVSA